MITLSNIKQYIGNTLFLLLIMAIVLDPSNTVLHLKDKFFVLLVGYSMIAFKPDLKYLVHIGLIFFAVLGSYVFSEMQGNHIDIEKFFSILKGFSPLVMLLWIKHYDAIKLSILPSFMACVMLFAMFILAKSSEEMEYALNMFFAQHDNYILLGRRYILGFEVFGLYLKSFVDLMFTLFIVFYYSFNSNGLKRRMVYILLMLVFTATFFISNTRSTMLLPFAMFIFVSFASVVKRRKAKYIVYPIVLILVVMLVGFIMVLASQKDEYSNAIKYAHLSSYIKLFIDNPQYLIFGQGPATMFYTEGFRRLTMETEWTYIELVRVYGLFSLLILAVVLYPVYGLWNYAKHDTYTLGIWGTYIIYLFIAGTNPLLLSSTGMIMILEIYSYLEKVKRKFPELSGTNCNIKD